MTIVQIGDKYQVMPMLAAMWPVCPTCDSAWVLRRCLLLSSGKWEWMWQRDCRHKSGEPKLGLVDSSCASQGDE